MVKYQISLGDVIILTMTSEKEINVVEVGEKIKNFLNEKEILVGSLEVGNDKELLKDGSLVDVFGKTEEVASKIYFRWRNYSSDVMDIARKSLKIQFGKHDILDSLLGEQS